MDRMTNEEAIKAIEEYLDTADEAGHIFPIKFLTALDVAISALKDEWIPTSERLPEEGKNVLFCDIDNDIMLGYHLTHAPATHFVEKGSWEDMKNVRAWMPKPEPYKESEEV